MFLKLVFFTKAIISIIKFDYLYIISDELCIIFDTLFLKFGINAKAIFEQAPWLFFLFPM